MAKKQMMAIEPHPDRILIKITQSEWSNMFSVWVRRNDGSKVQLFTDVEEDQSFDRRFQQNVSVGTIVAAGTRVEGILKGDVAIIDYLVTGGDDSLVGVTGGNRLVSITAKTTYHTEDALPYLDGRKAWVTGDYDDISKLLGVVRLGKLISMRPYIFLKYEPAQKMEVSEGGVIHETSEPICKREILAAHPDSGYKEGDMVMIKEADLFERTIDNKIISVIFEQDIIAVM